MYLLNFLREMDVLIDKIRFLVFLLEGIQIYYLIYLADVSVLIVIFQSIGEESQYLGVVSGEDHNLHCVSVVPYLRC